MSEGKNIQNFTAADIRDYWAGNLSADQMHALEKAAMEDPFLADALEGYQYDGSANRNITTLHQTLAQKAGAPATPIVNINRNKNTWLKVAASIIVIGGLGILVQQMFFNNQLSTSKSMADIKQDTAAKNNNDAAAGTSAQLQQSSTDTSFLNTTEVGVNANHDATPGSNPNAKSQPRREIPGSIRDTIDKDLDGIADRKDIAKDVKENEQFEYKSLTVAPANEKKAEFKNETISQRSGIDSIRDQFAKQKARNNVSQDNKTGNVLQKPGVSEGFMMNDKTASHGLNFSNRYSYRVVDAHNKPVPFANVMNTRDQVGTYTDIRGNFNLVSTDSVMDVQIRSLGYNPANYKLVPSNQTGDLVLREDEEGRKQILAQNKKVVTNVTRKDSTELEEPEVGWNNYNTYVANNIQIPETLRAKDSRSDVELSFDIDKNGNPVNIKVTKSSQCKVCDEEAIRLLKEGPKWKQKGKKNKTTISIAVDQR